MATTLYLIATTSGIIGIDGRPTDQSTAISLTGTAALQMLSTTIGSTNSTATVLCSTGPKTAPGLFVNSGNSPYLWISAPVSSSITISGTVTFNAWQAETAMTTNAAVGYIVWVARKDGSTSLIVSSNSGSEAALTTPAENSWTATPTSTTLDPGDVIIVAAAFDDAPSVTMASGTATLGYAGSAAGHDSFIQFTENISFASLTSSGTTTNFLADASDVGGSGSKRLWTDSASGSATYTLNTASGAGPIQLTDTAGGTALEWYTPQLQAATIEGTFSASIYGVESGTSANTAPYIRVYKTNSDGSNPIQVGRGGGTTEFGTTIAARTLKGHMGTTIVNGQRLMVRLYVYPPPLTGNMGNGFTTSMTMEDAASVSQITWPATLTEYSGVGPLTNATWGFIPI